MPRIETIKASYAPPPPKKMSKATREIVDAISRLKKDEVLRLQPDPDKSMRGLKTSVSRIAQNVADSSPVSRSSTPVKSRKTVTCPGGHLCVRGSLGTARRGG